MRRGTLQHEVLEGDRGAINIQADGHLEIPVTCLADAGSLDERVPYAMAVRVDGDELWQRLETLRQIKNDVFFNSLTPTAWRLFE